MVKNPPANAGDIRHGGLILGLGRSPGIGNGNPLQYSCVENSTDRGAWRAMVYESLKELDRTEHAQTHRHTDRHTHTHTDTHTQSFGNVYFYLT